MSPRIAFLHGGNNAQLRSFEDFSHSIDDLIYLGDLPRCDLRQYAAVIVPDAMDSVRIAEHARQLNDYARGGGFLIVFFQGEADWIDVVDLEWRPSLIRDWLWWTKGGSVEIHQNEPRHPICEDIPLPAMTWHWGGAYVPPPGAVPILSLCDGTGSLFLDIAIPGGGRLMVATLDPHLHNGQRFMPSATRFLQGFYPWLNRELGIARPAANRVTYLQCVHTLDNWDPVTTTESLAEAGFTIRTHPHLDIDAAVLEATDILYLPSNYDEYALAAKRDLILAYLARGGSMIICGEPHTPFLPFLSRFQAVPARPFANLKVRVRDDRAGFFAGMPEDFDAWQGVVGQYARGWSAMPGGAIQLTDVGPADDPKPADWLWRYPTETCTGGFVLMHNGDNLIRYPDHGPAKDRLVRDICLGLRALMMGQTVI
ncbi:hypothetical protein L1787_04855 [Acuticoccus sp. M5D2P5]|uniref:hypothetical protein n=1 Tax=Acuticoccus kalidii TaxID=2910977 RepID=UPI001F216ACA|nr:hypothetical protein [Acuticoccus kalidii]MCF3932745.1 hypothetical protein [Acuticoccus kalidii]